ncbi:Potassium voltage-gated channel subfamily G member 3 [Lemmus lemmus]
MAPGLPAASITPHAALPATAGGGGAHGVTRRGARGPGRGAGESQPERARRCGRARAGRRCARREQRSARSRRARRRTAREDGEGGPAPGSRSPLLAAAEPAHFASRLWTAAGLRASGTGEPCPRRLGYRVPSGRPAPPGAADTHRDSRRANPGARGGGSDTAGGPRRRGARAPGERGPRRRGHPVRSVGRPPGRPAMTFGRGGAASVVLNVGGARYSLSRELLKDFPLRRVSRLHGCRSERDVLEVCDDYDRERNEYFFDRHSEAFGFILLYVRGHGKLRFAPRMCELSFYNEMIYWGLEGAHLEYCCQRRLDDRMSDTHTFHAADELGREQARPAGSEAAPSRRWLERMRRTFEEPTSSLAAQILASVSVVFVIVSMVVLCASTLPDWRAAAADNRSLDDRSSRIIEAICIGWFTAECIVRFIVSKNKCEFVKRPLNIIDLLAITPYYISVLMTVFTGENSQLQRAGVTLRVLRMMRIFWVIKLARHFIGLQTLGLTLKRCYREMVMLLVFICVAMAIFSALSQLLEHGLDLETSNKDFASIPAACWWVIISMTTVGYGDMYPITVPGRILGGVCVVSGIVLLALPITFIYHSFVQCYHELKFRSARYSRSLSAEFLN